MKNLRKPKILIVDKSIQSLLDLQYTLQDQEFHIISASTAKEALRTIIEKQPDIVIIDDNLTDNSNFDLIKAIKTNEITKQVSIVFMSENDDPRIIETALQMGVSAYIKKPYHFVEMLSNVHTVLFRRFSKKMQLIEA